MMQPPKGTYDMLPQQKALYACLERNFDTAAGLYGFMRAETPILERIDVFERTLGAASDVVHKEMFCVQGKGDALVLRPENTASIMRMYLQNYLQSGVAQRLSYYGPMFRYERPQKGRYRQFYQCGVEHLGDPGWEADVEIIQLAAFFLEKLGVKSTVSLQINSIGTPEERQNYIVVLREYFQGCYDQLSPDSQRRLEHNVLRVLDSKDEKDQSLIANAPRMDAFLQDHSAQHFESVCDYLKRLGMAYTINHRLVRGLDYYNHTVFEFMAEGLGAQNTVLGGGRYDGLAETLGSKSAVPAVGWAAGIERLAMLMQNERLVVECRPQCVAVLPLQSEHSVFAHENAEMLRAQGVPCIVVPFGKLRKQLQMVSKMGLKYSILLGDRELEKKCVIVRDMERGQEDLVAVAELGVSMKERLNA